MKAGFKAFAGLVALVALSACGTARRGEAVTGHAIAAGPSVDVGATLFFEHCHKCHTGGDTSLGPALNNKPLPTFLMRFQVRHGLGAMPGFGADTISDQELDELLAYVKKLRRSGA
jgi:mono/diheme cytochrome c family protein